MSEKRIWISPFLQSCLKDWPQLMLLLCFVHVSQYELLPWRGQCQFLIVKTVKPFVLFLWFGQHGSHHVCDVNYSVFIVVPFDGKFLLKANQPTPVALAQFWITSCDTEILSKENSEVKKLHLKRISVSGKRTKIYSDFKSCNECFIMLTAGI